MFFSRAPSALMVFQWFCQRWTITIKCFLTSRPSTSMVFRWFSDFLGRWLTMVLKFQGYKKCVNSTRDKMCFRNAGERITALNSFRRAESYERGTDRDLIFLEIGTKSFLPSNQETCSLAMYFSRGDSKEKTFRWSPPFHFSSSFPGAELKSFAPAGSGCSCGVTVALKAAQVLRCSNTNCGNFLIILK